MQAETAPNPIEGGEVLIVDDDPVILDSLSSYLRVEGWAVSCAASSEEALKLMKRHEFGFIITDIMLPGLSGLELLKRIKKQTPAAEVIIMTGKSSEEFAVQALKAGAADYFSKPIRGKEVIATLLRSKRVQELKSHNNRLRHLVSRLTHPSAGHPLIGKAPATRKMVDQLKRVADNPNITVLLTGESGTGKEVAARTIHRLSRGDDAPYVALNCGGGTASLLERELFGHERGAFTGADRRVPGVFEMALDGTLMLDEISELQPWGQSTLMRVLEERSFRRLGGLSEVQINDTRIIAATNKSLERLIAEGKFREDLFFRLNVASVHIPPLREREGDIPILAEFLLQRTEGGAHKSLSPAAKRKLELYHFPGNVRELRNIIEHAAVFSPETVIGADDLLIPTRDRAGQDAPHADAPGKGGAPSLDLAQNEIRLIRQALEQTGSNHRQAARKLGITPQALYRRIEKYRIGG